jgi:membrane protein DedA with SNARE-associated domain
MTQDTLYTIMAWLDFSHENAFLLGIMLALTTLLFEDVAIAAAAGLILQASLMPLPAFFWVASGIAIGDIGLYALGRTAGRWPWLARRLTHKRAQSFAQTLNHNLFTALMLARIVPGLRTITFSAAGIFKVNFITFCAIVIPAVMAWTALLLFTGTKIIDFITNYTGLNAKETTLLLVLLLFLPILWQVIRQFFYKRKAYE